MDLDKRVSEFLYDVLVRVFLLRSGWQGPLFICHLLDVEAAFGDISGFLFKQAVDLCELVLCIMEKD